MANNFVDYNSILFDENQSLDNRIIIFESLLSKNNVEKNETVESIKEKFYDHLLEKEKEIILVKLIEKDFHLSIKKFETLTKAYENLGQIRETVTSIIAHCEYLVSKRLYNKTIGLIENKLTLFKGNLSLISIGVITSLAILDKESFKKFISFFDEQLANETKDKEVIDHHLAELVNEVERYANVDWYYKYTYLRLYHRKLLHSGKRDQLRQEDLHCLKEFLILNQSIEDYFLSMKVLFFFELRLLSYELARYVEELEEFDYLKHVSNDKVLKTIFKDFRDFQTGIIKIEDDEEFNYTREFNYKTQIQENPLNEIESNDEVKLLLQEYQETDDSKTRMDIESDLCQQVRLGVYDDSEKIDVFMSLMGMELYRVCSELVKRFDDELEIFTLMKYSFEKKLYFQVKKFCEHMLIDFQIDQSTFEIVVKYKAIAEKKIGDVNQAFKTIEVLKDKPKLYESLVDEIKNS